MVALHPAITRPLNEIQRLYQRCLMTGNGRAIRIICGSGGGKTHFLRLLQKLWPTEETDEATRVRIVSFSVPGSPSPEKLTKAMLRGMGDPGWNLKRDGIDRAFEMISEVGVYVVAIDNVQDIPEHRGTVGLRLSTNWIRDLIDLGRRLVVLIGTPAAEGVVLSNPQTRRRDPTKFDIPYFNIDPEANAARFKRFLREVDDLMPLAEFSGLEKYAAKLYWATYGIVDYIFKILGEALEIAVKVGRENITEADLAQGFELVFQDSAVQLNPFLKNGPCRLLAESGEPFEDWDSNTTIERGSVKPRKGRSAS